MGNQGCKLCVTIKSKIKIRKPPKFPTNNTTTVPSFTSLFQENLESNNASPLPLSDIPTFICQICFESKPLNDSFKVEGCSHFYCTKCTLKYIVSKLQDNVLNLVCPEQGCSGVLNPHYCKPILPNNVSVWWENALSESVIPENVKFYCPYTDCSALVINDGHQGVVIRDSKCPHCKRSICVQCKVPWHSDLTCKKFQRMKGKDDDLMKDLAKRRKWRRCPNCKHYVEKNEGCYHMTCRLVSFPCFFSLLHNVFKFQINLLQIIANV
ncbi:hypothetical protein RIF29_09245 [Crotalaria pallida]|uniref:RBR-type E3 ubiquitin transferase n=1 Tax=Crotalaria pallida TaxID=3830 RepID=A0AAN9FUH9_CROPI